MDHMEKLRDEIGFKVNWGKLRREWFPSSCIVQ